MLDGVGTAVAGAGVDVVGVNDGVSKTGAATP